MKLLHIDASILGANSVSRKISAAIVEGLRKVPGGIDVTYRDLAASPLVHLSGEYLAAAQGAIPEAPSLQRDMAASAAVLDELLASDVVVIGAPMYNFTVPTQLKAWIDRILVAGKTFRYGPQGVEGLAAGKRVIVAISRGGFYGYGTPGAPAEHLETYLRAVFGFIGITNLEFIIAEGVQKGPDQREKAIEEALRNATMLRAA
jgi:FMN-dependent NADH-azoreductase